MRLALVLVGWCLVSAAVGQNSFRSRQSGDWNQASTWEEFIAGSWQLTSNTPSSASGAITIQNAHTVTVTAAVTVDQVTVNAGATLVVNGAIVTTLSDGASTDLVVAGTLRLTGEAIVDGAGSISLSGTGRLELGSLNNTGALVTGTLAGNVRTSGARSYLSGAVVSYVGTGPQFIGSGHPGNLTSGVTSEINNLSGVTYDTNCGSNFTGGGTLYFPGALTLTQGNLNIVTQTGIARTILFTNVINANGNFVSLSGPATSVTFSGSGTTALPSPASTQTIGNLTINRPGATVTFPSTVQVTTRLTVSGNTVFNGVNNTVRDLVLNGGSVDFNGSTSITGPVTQANGTTIFFDNNALSLSGNYTSSGGVLASSGTSALTLLGSTPLSSDLVFANGSALQTLTLNKTHAGVSAVIGTPITLTGLLDLVAGTLSITAGNLVMGAGSSITKASTASIVTTAPSGGPWNLTYTGATQSTGLEIPATGLLSSLTINTNSSTTLSLSQDITVQNQLTIPAASRTLSPGSFNITAGGITNAGIFNAPNNTASTGLTLNGNFTNNGTFNHNGGTVRIGGASVFGGTSIATTAFNNVQILATGTLTAPSVLLVAGNLTVDGTLVTGTGLVSFSGSPSTLSGSNVATTNFYSITVGTGATLVLPSSVTLTRDLTVNGTLQAGSGTLVFAGTSALLGSNLGATVFHHLTVQVGSSLAAVNANLVINGDFTINGTFNPGTTGTLQVQGTSALSGAAIGSTNFVNLLITPAGSLTAPTTLNLLGNLTNNGVVNANGGTVVFAGGTGSRTVGGTTNTQFFDLRLNKTNGGTSLTVSSPQTVTNALILSDGILDIPGGNLVMNNGSSITKSSNAGISGGSPQGGPWSVTYVDGNQNTSLEIPAAGNLIDLTVSVNNGSSVALTQPITLSGSLSIPTAGRVFFGGSHNITVGTLNIAGTFNAPNASATTGLTINSSLVNNGTFVNNNGTVLIGGAVAFTGSAISTMNLNNLIIQGTGTLTAPSNLNIQGNFQNNGSFLAGTGTVTFTGTSGSKTISGSSNTQFYGLVVNKTNVGLSLTVTNPQTVTNQLTLTAGQFAINPGQLTLSSGATLTRNSTSSILTSSPGGGPWNLIYTGGNVTTGLENVAGSIANLSINSNSGAVVTLANPVQISAQLTISPQASGPTLTCGAQSVSAATFINGGIFNAPSTTLTLTGNFTNNGTFNRGTGTVVFAGSSSILGSSSTTFHHITISGTLSRPATLTLTGNFINNGSFAGAGGTVAFSGTAAQAISGSSNASFNVLDITNTVGVNVETTHDLTGRINMGAGARLDADGVSGNGVLTMISTSDFPTALDAQIGPLTGGAQVTGSVTVQRYMRGADNYDRFISSPVTNAPVSQLQDDFAVTGNFTGTSFPCTGCVNNGPSLKRYNETLTGAFNIGYTSVPTPGGTNAETLIPGVGYDAYMWNGVAPFVWDVRGPVNQGNVNFTVSHTVSSPVQPTADGWNLLGNPYPSAIQWNNDVGWAKTNIDATVWVWDVVGRVWRSYNADTQVGNLTNGVIALGQAFWVYVPTAAPASLSVNEQAKHVAATGTFYRQRALPLMEVTLSGAGTFDQLYIQEDERATDHFDTGLDVPKLRLGIEQMSLHADAGTAKGLGYVAIAPSSNLDLPLTLYVEKAGTYTFSLNVTPSSSLAGYFLNDLSTGVSLPAASATAYSFDVAQPSTELTDRFLLSKNALQKAEHRSVARFYPNPTTGVVKMRLGAASGVPDIKLFDREGRLVPVAFEVYPDAHQVTVVEVDMRALPAGIYMAKTLIDGAVSVHRIVKY